MENIKKKFQFLITFIDILKVFEIILVISFGFYQMYVKFDILLVAYKILYIVLIVLAILVIILINDSANCLLRGFFMIVENSYEEICERKDKVNITPKKKESIQTKKVTTKKKTTDNTKLGLES